MKSAFCIFYSVPEIAIGMLGDILGWLAYENLLYICSKKKEIQLFVAGDVPILLTPYNEGILINIYTDTIDS